MGKAKTRLAATIGLEKALPAYNLLLARTQTITRDLSVDKALFYSDYVEQEDCWDDAIYQKNSLGERMQAAFAKGFRAGYERIFIIGSD